MTDKFEQYKAKKTEEINKAVERTKRNLAIAERMKSDHDYSERIGEFGNKLHIWNIEEGDVAYDKGLQNPGRNFHRYQQDPVYQKLQGVRNTKGKNFKHGRSLAYGDFSRLADSAILGIMKKLQDRKMTEKEYTQLLEMPRSEVYNHVLSETHIAYQEAIKEAGYKEKRWGHSDEDFSKLREANRKAARTLEQVFNIDLTRDYPASEKRYTMGELQEMPPVLAKHALLLGRVDF